MSGPTRALIFIVSVSLAVGFGLGYGCRSIKSRVRVEFVRSDKT